MDHWHCQRCGAEQVTAPLSVARTKLAKSRHKLASHIFSNMTLFFIYFFDPLFRIFSPPLSPPLACILVLNPFTSEAGGGKKKNKNEVQSWGGKKKSRRRETSCILLFARLLKDIFCGSIARYNIQFGAHHGLASLSCVARVQRW